MTESRSDMEGLKRVEGLVAIPPGTARADPPTEIAQSIATRLKAAGILEQAKPFLRSGWGIADLADCPSGLPIYHSLDGRIYVLGRTMNVKFASSASEAKIRSVLRRHHLQKRRTLGFASNLMTVAPETNVSEDLYQISRTLALDPAIEFAEPNMVEELGGRS